MSLEKFVENALSSWMSAEGPEIDIVLSSRIRLARNLKTLPSQPPFRMKKLIKSLN